MPKYSLASVCVAFLFVVSGCGAQKGATQIKYEKGQDVQMISAPEDGKYALFTMTDVTPHVVKGLQRGEQLGFERINENQVRAIAGDYSKVLPTSTAKAYWKLQK